MRVLQIAGLPEFIESARQLYDLRTKYKDASVLITAIYSESQVVAATLAQVQTLLEHDTLRKKPELLETFDRALTGCRVVYACLDEEVQELVRKAEADDLKFRDKAKFLWKEDTFKELLTQIRGQQSGLSLLVQGLQIESIAEVKKLVEDNSVTLDMALKGSKTLRKSHPNVKVPESVFNRQDIDADSDNQSFELDAEFAFDDDVVNSKAYRRVMAIALSRSRSTILDDPNTGPLEEESTALGTVRPAEEEDKDASTIVPLDSGRDEAAQVIPESDVKPDSPPEAARTEEHEDLFGSLERDFLAFMPPTTSTNSLPTVIPTLTSTNNSSSRELTPAPAPAQLPSPSGQLEAVELETPPPLPPRRPSGNTSSVASTPQMRSVASNDSMHTWDAPTIFSQPSAASSYTMLSASTPNLLARPMRKPLPPAAKASYGSLHSIVDSPSEYSLLDPTFPFHNAEMRVIWISLADSEKRYVDRMKKFKSIFYDNVVRQWPSLEGHLGAILVGEQLACCHLLNLVSALEADLAAHPSALCNPRLIEYWIPKAQPLYREYAYKMPHAMSSLRKIQSADPKFTPFVNSLGLSIAYFGMGWEDYLHLPRLQLQSYSEHLQKLVSVAETVPTPAAKQELDKLRSVLQTVNHFSNSVAVLFEAAQGREDVQNVYKRLRMDVDTMSKLCLLDPSRRLKYQGGMALKYKGQGPWNPIHGVLFDNCFLWGKAKKNKGDEILVTTKPVMLTDIEVSLPEGKHIFQKATVLDYITRGCIV